MKALCEFTTSQLINELKIRGLDVADPVEYLIKKIKAEGVHDCIDEKFKQVGGAVKQHEDRRYEGEYFYEVWYFESVGQYLKFTGYMDSYSDMCYHNEVIKVTPVKKVITHFEEQK